MGSSGEVRIDDNKKVVLFDGVCNLCNCAVSFITKHDKKDVFRFASLQSAFGQRQLIEHHINTTSLQTIIVIYKDLYFDRSNAVLEIARSLNGAWPVLYIFKIIPRFLRDALYSIVARYRYRIFGKADSCMMPTPYLRSKFLE